ncbi:MAG TPA: purine-nucleoside phosphorylase [Deferrimonas sp.]|jgi:purine-nucleoside phosphorylase
MDSSPDDLIATLRRKAGLVPFDLAVVLGSGLGAFAEQLADPIFFPYRDFPCFPPSTVAGHAGRLVAGNYQGWRVLAFQGRHHLYEGYDARQVTVNVRIAHALGVPRLLLTNACGAVNRNYRAGDFMYIADHINLLGDNPLRGEAADPFIDLSHLYRQDLFVPLHDHAQREGISLHRGVLAALPGPSYETPAEIRALSLLGADAVSMSTVPEAILGKYLGLEVVGLSFLSNAAAGLGTAPLNHQEVLAAGRLGTDRFLALLCQLIRFWREAGGPSASPGESSQVN